MTAAVVVLGVMLAGLAALLVFVGELVVALDRRMVNVEAILRRIAKGERPAEECRP